MFAVFVDTSNMPGYAEHNPTEQKVTKSAMHQQAEMDDAALSVIGCLKRSNLVGLWAS